MGSFDVLSLEPTVFILRHGEGLAQRAVLRLTGGEPGPAEFIASLDGERLSTKFTLTGDETTVSVEIPSREIDETLEFLVTDCAGGMVSQRIPWKAQRRWEVHFIPVTHHDLGYTEAIEPLLDTYCGYYDRILDFCRETSAYSEEAQYRYTVEELWSLEEYLRRVPEEKKKELLHYIREGRIEISALYANVIDSLCDEEELIRLLYPAARMRETYGIPVDTASLVDMPGLSWGTIRALSKAGIRRLFAGFPKYFEWADTKNQKLDMKHSFWDEKALLPHGRPCAFRWMAQDGGEVLTWYQAGYGWFGNDKIPCLETDSFACVYEHLPVFLRELEEKGTPYHVMRYIDHGSDNQAPQRYIADIVRTWNEQYAYPRLVVSTNRRFFDRLEAECGDAPILAGELPHTDYTVLSLTAAGSSALNACNRLQARQTQCVSTAANQLAPAASPMEDFTDIYRDILLYDEHCYGMSLPMGAAHAFSWSSKQHYMRRAAYAIEQRLKQSCQTLNDALKLEPGKYVTVFQPSPRRQEQVLAIGGEELPERFILVDPDDGRELPLQTEKVSAADLPLPDGSERYAFGVMDGRLAGYGRQHFVRLPPFPFVGYKTYLVRETAECASVPGAQAQEIGLLENEYYRIEVDPETGDILHFLDKAAGRDLTDPHADYGFGSLICRNMEDGRTDCRRRQVRVERRMKGPLAESLVIRGALTGCPETVQEIVLYKQSRDVDISYRLLKDAAPFQEIFAAFPFSGQNPHFLYKGTSGILSAFAQQLPGSNTHQYTTQGWAQVQTDENRITIGSVEARVVEFGALRPTAVSQAHHGIHPNGFEKAFAAEAGPCAHVFWMLAYNNCQTNFSTTQNGEMLYRFRLASGESEFTLPPVVWAFEAEKENKGTIAPSGKLFSWNNEAVELLAFKLAEDENGVILRLSNEKNEPCEIQLLLHDIRWEKVWLCDAVERVSAPLAIDAGAVRLQFKAHDLLTLRFV